MDPAAPLECVALVLIRDRSVLVEKRKLTKRLAPGTLAVPGGHVHLAEELRRLHYFAVRSWKGAIVPDEAESVVWLALDDGRPLDFDVDRTAVSEYQRLSREGGLAWRTKR